ncbi:MAG: hypothetical protein WDN28_24785 [Chthoniobacter sp.]
MKPSAENSEQSTDSSAAPVEVLDAPGLAKVSGKCDERIGANAFTSRKWLPKSPLFQPWGFFDITSGTAGAAGGKSFRWGEEPITAPDEYVAIPAAFQPLAPNDRLTENQKALEDALRDKFANEVQPDPGAPPASPPKWQKAQLENDQRFKLLFGVQAFLQREKQGNLHSGNSSD